MDFSTDEQHQVTLALLAEARSYLQSLPVHPMHRKMIEKIEAHLLAPQAKLVSEAGHQRESSIVTPAGEVRARAVVHKDTVTVFAPAVRSIRDPDSIIKGNLLLEEMRSEAGLKFFDLRTSRW